MDETKLVDVLNSQGGLGNIKLENWKQSYKYSNQFVDIAKLPVWLLQKMCLSLLEVSSCHLQAEIPWLSRDSRRPKNSKKKCQK